MMRRFEFLSKCCKQQTKENAELQSEYDRLTKENQMLKKTMMRKFTEHFVI